MVLLNSENRLLTGSADSELRAWDINYLEEVRTQKCIYHFLFMIKCHIDDPASVVVKAPSLSQAKAEGEPKVKKGKTLLEENDDDEDNEEEVDESLEEVRENQRCKSCNKVH